MDKDSLLKLLPTGTLLTMNGAECRYIELFTVALGGYATLDVAKFHQNGKAVYLAVDIADATLGLPALLADCLSKPFAELSTDMRAFVTNHFNATRQKHG